MRSSGVIEPMWVVERLSQPSGPDPVPTLPSDLAHKCALGHQIQIALHGGTAGSRVLLGHCPLYSSTSLPNHRTACWLQALPSFLDASLVWLSVRQYVVQNVTRFRHQVQARIDPLPPAWSA